MLKPSLQSRLLTACEAAAYLSLPTAAFERLRIGRVVLGRRVLYDRVAIDAWLDDLSGVDSAPVRHLPDDSAEAALARFLDDQRHAPGRP